MAYVLLFLLIRLILNTADFSYLVLFVVYGVDGGLTIINRLVLKENILQAHRKHVYQIMVNELKIPHLRVTLLYMLLQIAISAGYFCMPGYGYLIVEILLLGILYTWFIKRYFYTAGKL